MNDNQYRSQARQYAGGNSYLEEASQAQISAVLRNTYSLLAMTLAFSAFTCYVAMAMNVQRLPIIIFFVGAYGLMFATSKLKNSVWGLVTTFAFTGFMGFTLAPTLNAFLTLPNGAQIITNALGLTAFAFLGLSAFVLVTRKDMSFLSSFITVGAFVLIGAMLLFFGSAMLSGAPISGLYMAISVGFVLFSSAVILFQTSAIIHGGETNYVMATITLFVSIYNLFISLLSILGVASGD